MGARAVDALSGGAKISLCRLVDVGHIGLWIAVDQREPAALHLNHDPMTRLEGVIAGSQTERVRGDLSGNHRLGLLEAIPVARPEYLFGEHELEATHVLRLSVRVDIDEFYHPVTVRSGGGGEQVNEDRK